MGVPENTAVKLREVLISWELVDPLLLKLVKFMGGLEMEREEWRAMAGEKE